MNLVNRVEYVTKKIYYAKPKISIGDFNKGNYYYVDEDTLKEGKPISDTIIIQDKNKNWKKVSAFDFVIIPCLFNGNAKEVR